MGKVFCFKQLMHDYGQVAGVPHQRACLTSQVRSDSQEHFTETSYIFTEIERLPSNVAVWLRLKCRGTPLSCVVWAPSHCRWGLPAWLRAKLSDWGTTEPSQYLQSSARIESI